MRGPIHQRIAAPVIATHSACRRFTPGWERNMDDQMIKLLAEKGGTIQIAFGSGFVNKQINAISARRKDRILAHLKSADLTPDQQEEYADRYVRDNPLPRASIADVVTNIDHVVNLVGIDHVGLGSDFDGLWGELPAALTDVSCYPNLINELLKTSYTQKQIKKISAENTLQTWSTISEAEAT
ncbi:MAG: membrane dipeptidase [Sedimentisphaerales bacterium]|nr:membrane dipeptidase [Sedimentisphaerales bacterium]